jgi:hypothetical protein
MDDAALEGPDTVTDKCPFVNLPETGRARWGEILDAEKMKKCVWVRPKQVAVVDFLEWTEGERLRHSKFVGLRDDKEPQRVVKSTQGRVKRTVRASPYVEVGCVHLPTRLKTQYTALRVWRSHSTKLKMRTGSFYETSFSNNCIGDF